MKRSLLLRILVPTLAVLAVGFLGFYFLLPALNMSSPGFWMLLFVLLAVWSALWTLGGVTKSRVGYVKPSGKMGMILTGLCAIPILVLVLGQLFSATFFHADKYASVISVQEAVFEEDMPESTSVSNIALMDTASAAIIGNRALGALSDVVSQYEISPTYTQINYLGAPQKVANLEYAGFFKWLNNRGRGIPGYIQVDPVNNTAEYREFAEPLQYVNSGYLNDDLLRKVRFAYPTKIFGSCYFEVDEEGNPYYVLSCMAPRAGLFGAMDVQEVILFNPCDGSSVLYDVRETPSWVDIVYTGDLASQKYNWYGMLSGGFWNSVIGNVGCKQTTDDYGYIILGDDVWYFTGVTSVVADESNIGFIITNARTGEYKFYPVVGAEEYSAMAAAEGEVQEKDYHASFPSLINVSGQATYILVLKDNGGLVKLYALVNVENYGIVATGSTQREAMAAYQKLLVSAGRVDAGSADAPSVSITVENVRIVTVDGQPVVYITATDGSVYKSTLTEDESLILVRAGDELTVTAEPTGIEDLYQIVTYTRN